MSEEKLMVIFGGNGVTVITLTKALEILGPIRERQKLLASNQCPATKPQEVEPWQNKRRTPWRKRK